MTDLEIRSATLTETDTQERTIHGIAVPWGQDADIAGAYTERFERGAIGDVADTKLYWQHGEIIGRVIAGEDRDDGFHITAKVSKTQRGDEALELARDGAISKLSIGFTPVDSRDDGGVVVREKVTLHEVSMVPFPAYKGADISEVRTADQIKEGDMADAPVITAADLDEVRGSIEELDREVRLLATPKDEEPAEPQFRSFGEYVKAVASGDEAAQRAYSGAVSGDTVLKDAWVGNLVHLIGEKQRIKNAFSTGPLPAEGMGVEYAVLETDTTSVTEQAAEGEDLAFGKVSITTDSAKVKTFGGYSSLSRQAIERANVGILDTTFQALAIKYAKAIETYVRGIVTTGVTAAEAIEADLTTQDGVIAAILDLVEAFDDNDRTLSGIFVSKDVFTGLLAVSSSDRILQVAQAPTDKAGTVTITSATGNIAGVSVSLFPGAAAGTAFGYDKFAVKTLESPGAPLRLQDESVVNLSKDFSVYGYGTSYVQAADGLIRIDEAE